MRAPDFWAETRGLGQALAPLGLAWRAVAATRQALVQPWRASVPVLCIGNIVVGGAGKTPLALALTRHLMAVGRSPHILSRGYGGSLAGPLRVDANRHTARDVGDEAILLAGAAPTWVARDRVAGARAAIAGGADIIVMDDGFQNPSLAKDVSIVAVDGAYGFGNGRIMPAGPLREKVTGGLARAQAAVIIGPDTAGSHQVIAPHCPVFEARLVPQPDNEISKKRVFAFAGIGRPAKFYATLQEMGCSIEGSRDFPDHHPYSPEEIMRLCEDAAAKQATLVTTEKDLVRVPVEARPMVRAVAVDLAWADPATPDRLLVAILDHG